MANTALRLKRKLKSYQRTELWLGFLAAVAFCFKVKVTRWHIKPVSLKWGGIITQPGLSLCAAGQEQEITSQVWTVSHHIPVGQIRGQNLSTHTHKKVLWFSCRPCSTRANMLKTSVHVKWSRVVFPVLLHVGPVAVSFWQRLAAPCGKSQWLLVNRVYEWAAVSDLTQKGHRAAQFTAPYSRYLKKKWRWLQDPWTWP